MTIKEMKEISKKKIAASEIDAIEEKANKSKQVFYTRRDIKFYDGKCREFLIVEFWNCHQTSFIVY